MLNLNKTHRIGSSQLESLTVSAAVPCEVCHAVLRLRADLRAAFIPVSDLGRALYSPVPRTPSTSE